jgi:hypothetical protein
VRRVTAVAALLFFGENNVSFVINNQLLAFGRYIGLDAVAKLIVSARCLIGSLPVVDSIVEHKAVKSVSMIGDGEGLVVGDSEGGTPNGWRRRGKLR